MDTDQDTPGGAAVAPQWRRAADCDSNACPEISVTGCDSSACPEVMVRGSSILIRNSTEPDNYIELSARDWMMLRNGDFGIES